jgi:uncharacterized protein
MKLLTQKFIIIILLFWSFQNNINCQSDKYNTVSESLVQLPAASTKIEGYLGDRIDLCISQRIKALDFDQFVEPFRHRNETHLWQGEFFGKLMQAAIASYGYNHDPEMLARINKAFRDFIATQSKDGYIGNYADSARLLQWDVWCRKYSLLSLISYYDLTGDKTALKAATKLAGYTLSQIGPGKADIVKTGNYRGMPSSSILEPMVYLYRRTGNIVYLDFAKYIVTQWETSGGPNLISKALSGVPVSERFPQPKTWWSWENGQKAYEMMSCYNGLLELYKVTGEATWLKATEASVKNIIESEINISGSGTAFECFYKGAIHQTEPTYHMMETCVTFTWMQLCNNLLRITGNPLYADQIEKTAYNALLAAMKDDGTQIAKYSPLEGTRSEGEKQCGMDINCCNANGPRGYMLLPSFMVMKNKNEIVINLYGKSESTVQLNPEIKVRLNQVTDYPVNDKIEFLVNPDKPGSFTISLRIPEWSQNNAVSVNGIEQPGVSPGKYFRISRLWNPGDKILLKLDLRAKLVNMNGFQAITRGPVVLARDSRFTDGDVDEAAVVSLQKNQLEIKISDKKPDNIWMAFTVPMVLGTNLEGADRNPKAVHLCDFASAGNNWREDSRYRVWIKKTLNVMNMNYTGY